MHELFESAALEEFDVVVSFQMRGVVVGALQHIKMQIELHQLLEGLRVSPDDYANSAEVSSEIVDLVFMLCGLVIGLSFVIMILRHC